MKGVLEELVHMRRTDAEKRASTVPIGEIMRLAEKAPPPRDFAGALTGKGRRIIAELKQASPSEGLIREDFRPEELARELEEAGAAALSVLCEPHRFLGSGDYLKRVRKTCSLPLLWKDFVTTPYQIAEARAAGADAVLLIAAALGAGELASLLAFAEKTGIAALVETHSEDEIATAAAAGADIVGVNCRDLGNFSTNTELFGRLTAAIPGNCIRVAESGMHSPEDIARAEAAGADAFLVGTALMKSASPGEKLKCLLRGN